MIRHSDRESAVARTIDPIGTAWGQDDHLLASLVDLTQTLVWMKTKDATKGRNRPKPLQRPGSGPDKFGSASMSIEETEAWIASRKAAWTCAHGDDRPVHKDGVCLPHYRASRRKKTESG